MSEQEHQQNEQSNEPTDEQIEASDDVVALRTEAKNRRLKLREVEGERDALRERIDGRDQDDVEQLIADRLEDPTDFTVPLDELRDDGGNIDQGRVEEAVGELLKSKPHFAKRPAEKVEATDLHQGARGTRPKTQEPSFGQAFKSGRR